MFLSRDLFLFYGVSPPDRFAFDWKTMPQVTACLYFRTHLITNLGEIWGLNSSSYFPRAGFVCCTNKLDALFFIVVLLIV
jgi:hypothetical protein